MEKAKQDDALSDLSNLLGELKEMAIDMGSEIERLVVLIPLSVWCFAILKHPAFPFSFLTLPFQPSEQSEVAKFLKL